MRNRVVLLLIIFCSLLGGGMSACHSDAEPESLSELMRERTNQLQAMQQAFEQGEAPPGNLQKITHFAGAPVSREALEDPGVQGQLKAFETFYARFAENPDPKTYNMVIKTCISCHERLCPGPLRLIRSLSLEPVEEPGLTFY